MIKCCEEHIDIALDTIVDDYQEAPIINKIDENGKLSTTCEYCDKPAIYMVSN